MEQRLSIVKSFYSPVDLCSYKSLRKIALLYSIGFFLIDYVYISHYVIIDKIGLGL